MVAYSKYINIDFSGDIMDTINSTKDIVRSILGMNKLKYKVLDSFNIGIIDALHIDLDSILLSYKKYYKTYPELMETDLMYTICSSIINTAAHYRHYFFKSGNGPAIYLHCTKHNFNDFQSIEFTQIICKYIPKMYVVIGNKQIHNSSTIIKYFIRKHNNNLVLTKNILHTLLVNDHTSVIKLNKDKSILYSNDNFYESFTRKEYDGNISPKLAPIAYACTGTGCNNVKGVGPSKIVKLLDKCIKKNRIVNSEYPSIEIFLNDIKDIHSFNNEKLIIKNFIEFTDINGIYRQEISKGGIEKLDSQIIDKIAYSSIKELNIKYFTGFDSLMLNELFELPKQKTINW